LSHQLDAWSATLTALRRLLVAADGVVVSLACLLRSGALLVVATAGFLGALALIRLH